MSNTFSAVSYRFWNKIFLSYVQSQPVRIRRRRVRGGRKPIDYFRNRDTRSSLYYCISRMYLYGFFFFFFFKQVILTWLFCFFIFQTTNNIIHWIIPTICSSGNLITFTAEPYTTTESWPTGHNNNNNACRIRLQFKYSHYCVD